MADHLTRIAPPDLHVRASGDGRTVYGVVVPYDQQAPIRDQYGNYSEVFRYGAFAKSIAQRGDRLKLLVNHQRTQTFPIGRSTLLREDTGGLVGEFRVSKTTAGDEALELVRDGAVDSFSIGFSPLRDNWSKDRSSVERLEAKLGEVSLVAFPAYEGAAVAGVRAAGRTYSAHLERLALAISLEKFNV